MLNNQEMTIKYSKNNIKKDSFSTEDYVNWGFIHLENKNYDEALKWDLYMKK